MVDSCRNCKACEQHFEMFCSKCVFTYGSKEPVIGGQTHGGYSKEMICDKDFIINIPDSFTDKLPGIASLLCAGITTYTPLRLYDTKPGKVVGVIGLGGLGHVAIKIAHAMGAKVIVFTRSSSKIQDAKRLGADDYILSVDSEQMKSAAGTLDLILDTVSGEHDIASYLSCLKYNGTLVLLGILKKLEVSPNELIFGNRAIAGSLIGSIKDTQEMMNFCAEHDITVDYELIKPDCINDSLKRLENSDVKYRFVIDIQYM